MKRHWNMLGRTLVAALLLAAMLAAPMGETASAVTQSDIDNLESEASSLAQQRKALKSELASLKNDKANAVYRRNLLDQQIEVTEKEITNTEHQISGYEALLSQTAYELEENQAQEAEQYTLFCQRARMMEEQGTPSFWEVLFSAEDFSDLLGRLSDVQMVIDYDQSLMDDIMALRGEIETKQETQEQLKGESEAAKTKLEEQKVDLSNQREEANQLVKEIEANVEEYAEALQQVQDEEEQIQKEIVKKTEELAAQLGWSTSVGGYIWPCTTSRRITSPMGGRNTGIPGASTNHKGVDIGGVGYTTNVLATKAGVVITSKHSSSYGNYVVISHGRGNTTLYAHMSSRAVSEGQTVSQGQVIGISGSTGISSGPHIHYEITENGSRVDPLNYLPGYIKAW